MPFRTPCLAPQRLPPGLSHIEAAPPQSETWLQLHLHTATAHLPLRPSWWCLFQSLYQSTPGGRDVSKFAHQVNNINKPASIKSFRVEAKRSGKPAQTKHKLHTTFLEFFRKPTLIWLQFHVQGSKCASRLTLEQSPQPGLYHDVSLQSSIASKVGSDCLPATLNT